MNEPWQLKTIEDISFLYEISLSIGQSLDLNETVSHFVNTLMTRKSFDYVSLWANMQQAKGVFKGDTVFELLYANPLSYISERLIAGNCMAMELLSQKDVVQIQWSDVHFDTLRTEKNINGKGAYILYPLGSFGFVKIYTSRDSGVDQAELNKLIKPIRKLTNAMLACIYHDQVKNQAEEMNRLLEEQKNTSLKLETLIDSMNAGILFEDSTRHIAHINQEFCNIFQIPVPAELLFGVDCSSAADTSKHLLADPQGFVDGIQPILDKGERVLGEEIVFADGRIFERNYIPIQRDNVLMGHMWQYRDITSRKQAELEVKQREEQFHSMFTKHKAIMLLVDGQSGMIVDANDSAIKFYGRDLPGEKLSLGDLKSGTNHASEVDILESEMDDKRIYLMDQVVAKGELRHVEIHASPIQVGSRNLDFLIIHDISDRKAIEDALKQSDERWHFALEGSGDGVWDWNATTNEVFFSNSWKTMLGYQPSEVGNSLEEWSSRIHPEDKEKCFEDLNKHFNGETTIYTNEHRMRTKSGDYVWILDRGMVIEWEAPGKPKRVIGTHSDITKAKELEETLRQGIEKEKELSELKSRFVSIASHEFRTPLATIMAASDVLCVYRSKMTQDQIDYRLNKIKGQVAYLTSIVEDVLQLSKMQEGRTRFDPKQIEFVSFCVSIADELNNHLVSPRIVLHSDIKELIIRVDDKLMRQTISNLLSNALKFSPPDKKVTMNLKQKGRKLEIRIEDQGIGIPESDRQHLFEPFQRGHNTTGIPGSGLGLSIVKSAVESHGGNIKFTSKVGKGTTFIINLPVKKA